MKVSRETRRFFVESLDGETVELSAVEAHHSLDVLRLTDGTEVEVFDGIGGSADGTLHLHSRKQAEVHILRRRRAQDRPEPLVELAFAVPKGKRLDWLLEKTTELGAARLIPVIFERSVAKTAPSNRWRRTCIAAAKQCGADFLPEIASARKLPDFLAETDADIRILGDAGGEMSIPIVIKKWSSGKRITVLIGPEGGLTDAEDTAAGEAGFLPVRLGNFTLRVETAAVALLAAVNACCQE
ncbi:MAG: 16S rRNA (uracil(1498)-N(3))-methyltransferase [Phycisphaerae bacterium]|nr:16S rRNA (uracil(1498)-N(3))-methyltransferase [Phycisphaerae bacterium]